MTRPADFKPGARVLWGGTGIEYTVWSLHEKRGWVWITRDGRPPVEARVKNLELIAPGAVPDPPRVVPIRAPRPAPKATAADQRTITAAIMRDAPDHDGIVSPNRVRAALAGPDGALTVHPQALSGMYSTLAARGVLRSMGWHGVNDDTRSGNAGRPMRLWQWVEPLPAEATA